MRNSILIYSYSICIFRNEFARLNLSHYHRLVSGSQSSPLCVFKCIIFNLYPASVSWIIGCTLKILDKTKTRFAFIGNGHSIKYAFYHFIGCNSSYLFKMFNKAIILYRTGLVTWMFSSNTKISQCVCSC